MVLGRMAKMVSGNVAVRIADGDVKGSVGVTVTESRKRWVRVVAVGVIDLRRSAEGWGGVNARMLSTSTAELILPPPHPRRTTSTVSLRSSNSLGDTHVIVCYPSYYKKNQSTKQIPTHLPSKTRVNPHIKIRFQIPETQTQGMIDQKLDSNDTIKLTRDPRTQT